MSKRNVFDVKEKMHIIWRLENGESNSKLAREYGISNSTISTIWKSKEKIKNLFKNNSFERKRARSCTRVALEQALLKWLKYQKTKKVKVTGPMLQKKAKELACDVDDNNSISSSWLQRFRVRNNIYLNEKSNTPGDEFNGHSMVEADDLPEYCDIKNLSFTSHESNNDLDDNNIQEQLDLPLLSAEINENVMVKIEDNYTDIPDEIKMDVSERLFPSNRHYEDHNCSTATNEKSEENAIKEEEVGNHPPSLNEALDAVKILQKFIMFKKKFDSGKNREVLDNLEYRIYQDINECNDLDSQR